MKCQPQLLGTGKLYSLFFKRIFKSILIPFGFQVSQVRPVIKRTNPNGPICTFLIYEKISDRPLGLLFSSFNS